MNINEYTCSCRFVISEFSICYFLWTSSDTNVGVEAILERCSRVEREDFFYYEGKPSIYTIKLTYLTNISGRHILYTWPHYIWPTLKTKYSLFLLYIMASSFYFWPTHTIYFMTKKIKYFWHNLAFYVRHYIIS